MRKLEIYKTLLDMNFNEDDIKRETLNNRINWVMNLLGCDYQSAYRAVKSVRCGEEMQLAIWIDEDKRVRKELKGCRAWYNRNVKPQYRTTLTEKEFIEVVYSEFVNTGNVEIISCYSKTGCPLTWG